MNTYKITYYSYIYNYQYIQYLINHAKAMITENIVCNIILCWYLDKLSYMSII